jgi:hypothetical protein
VGAAHEAKEEIQPMLNVTKRLVLAVAAVLALGAAMPLKAEGPAMLTVTGSVENTNRGPVDPEMDKLFAFNEVSFDKAMEFDLGMLESLPQATVKTDFPKGGQTVEFTGPTLGDLLGAAGASGATVTVQAMDGYAVEVPAQELIAKGAVIALARDGKPMGIGGFGPAQIVFPRAEWADLAEMPDDWWIWQIFHIKVE